jgi:hypothetical protein
MRTILVETATRTVAAISAATCTAIDTARKVGRGRRGWGSPPPPPPPLLFPPRVPKDDIGGGWTAAEPPRRRDWGTDASTMARGRGGGGGEGRPLD